ncbi:hypothetical protein LCGC14_1948250 [marine sediment metagenome]|uniref:Uncharacterized protein n=1 Tax=marine sediment metagenome TaxID=412755 RepID=A0A0F9HWJ3_9ZZZZ
MTTELKTVNELNFDEIDRKGIDQGCTFEDMVKKWLKKEAIKWVKNKKEKKKIIETKGANRYAQGYIDALIDFHNITEEDLK